VGANHSYDRRGKQGRAYAEAALDGACGDITQAAKGSQALTLHKACYGVGGLIASGLINESEARARLYEAALRMPSYGERWRPADLRTKVEVSIRRGMMSPRTPPEGRGFFDTRARTPPTKPSAMPERSGGATTTDMATRLWREGQDPRGTLAEAYFRTRALDLPDDLAGEVLRWHTRTSALLALFRNILTNEPQAVSRIFLDAHGAKIERKFLGPVADAAVMLDSFDAVLESLHVGEGVETCMAARQLGMRPCWALGDAGGVAKLPLLGGVGCLTIIAEDCPRNAEAIEVCGTRWHEAGREVLIDRSVFGKDLNDALMMTAKGKDRADSEEGAVLQATRTGKAPDHVEEQR
jgi:hypothetical protein